MAAFLLHLPFVVRYDLHFQPDFAISALMSRAIAFEGERPVFFWDQGYLGSWGCWVTALLFRVFGFSLPLAAGVSLAVWSAGVALTTWLAGRLLDERAAWWTAAATAIASPYANHYVTQPYSSYETAPVLAVLAIAGLRSAEELVARPATAARAAAWTGLGVLLGFAWWTSRLVVPAVLAAAGAAAVTAGWRPERVRRAVAGLALLGLGALVGASPEIGYRLAGGAAAASEGTSLTAVAPVAAMPGNLANALRALPAYFDGDPRARAPEGVAFAERIAAGLPPHATMPAAFGMLDPVLDVLGAFAAAVVLLVAAVRGLRAWRERDAPLLALCLTPFVQLALIMVGAQSVGGYYHVRRYWFSALLVLALLFAVAVDAGERARPAALRWATRTLAALVLASSVIAQARMLRLPDELAPYRLLARDLVAHDERAVFMPTWSSWIVAALSGGRLDGANVHYNHEPVLARIGALDEIAFARRADEGFPGMVGVGDVVFVPGDDAPRRVGPWHWRHYERREE